MTCADLTTDRSRGVTAAPLAIIARLWKTLVCWRRRAVERRQLAQMPRERWKDIAKEPDAVRREIAKPFWRP